MKFIIGLAVILLLVLAGCTITGNVVKETDSCTSLEGAAKDNCYLEQKKCSSIENSGVQDSCIVELAVAKNDINVCDLINSERTREYCIYQFAVKENNQSICLQIEGEYWNSNCYDKLARSTGDHTLCWEIGFDIQRHNCVEAIAIENEKIDVCLYLPDSKKDGCLFDIARKASNLEACEAMIHPLNKDVCMLKLAKMEHNATTCRLINSSVVRITCKEYFNSTTTD